MNLETYYSEKLNTDVVTTSNLHSALELSKSQYCRSLKTWMTDFYGFQNKVRTPIEGTDFSIYTSKTSLEGGRTTIDYEITIEFAKLITLNSRSQVKQHYAQWLLELERKLNNLEIITVEQAVFIQKMIQLFQFISNQKQVLKEHSQKFVGERLDRGGSKSELYSFFHNWRNSKLDISPDEINERIKEFCINNQRSISLTKKSKFDKVFTMDNYETLKHAVWDYLQSKDRPEVALKVAEITYKIAKNAGVDIVPDNETNLFQKKIETGIKLQLKKINTAHNKG